MSSHVTGHRLWHLEWERPLDPSSHSTSGETEAQRSSWLIVTQPFLLHKALVRR